MTKRRRNALAIAVVVVVTAATVAYAALQIQPSDPVTVTCGSPGGSGAAGFVIHNTGPDQVNVTSFDPQIGPCSTYGFTPPGAVSIPVGGNGSFTAHVGPGVGEGSCTFDIMVTTSTGSGSGCAAVLPALPMDGGDVTVVAMNCISGGPAPIEVIPSPTLSFTPSPPVGSFTDAVATVRPQNGVGTTSMSSATITGVNATEYSFFMETGCSGQLCTFGAPVPLGTRDLTIRCQPTGFGQRFAQLNVFDPGGGSDSTQLDCTGGTASAPEIRVVPNMVDLMFVTVGTPASPTGPDRVTVYNDGTGPLTISGISLNGAGATEWAIGTCQTGCTVAAGANRVIDVTLTPSAWGPAPATMVIASNDADEPMTSVSLDGTGLGAELTSPTGMTLNFGSPPIGVPTTLQVQMYADGNVALDTTGAASGAPYAVTAPATHTVMAQTMSTFDVTCTPTGAGPMPGSFTFTAPDAYGGSPIPFTASCTGVDTAVMASPNTLPFGELRNGSPTVTMPVHLTNTGGAPAMFHAASLSMDAVGLAVNAPGATTIAPGGGTLDLDVSFTPTEDVVLDGRTLDLSVDDDLLQIPITGAAVTATVVAAPSRLDFGQLCLGDPGTKMAALMANGTGKVGVNAPAITGEFDLVPRSPNVYPPPPETYMILPDESATVDVSPMMAPGPRSGTLTWTTDLPSEVPVELDAEYVDTGAAVSPGLLDFGMATLVDEHSQIQMVTVQNCGGESIDITNQRLEGHDPTQFAALGPPLPATLLPGGEIQIYVTFQPTSEGSFAARLVMSTAAGDAGGVDLTGATPEATGGGLTNYYACGCSGAGGALPGMIALVVVLALPRRRRVTSRRSGSS